MRKIIFTLCFLCAPTFAHAQRLPVTVDLSAPLFSTVEQSNGFHWVVRGLVFPANTYPQPQPGGIPSAETCVIPDNVVPIGNYVIFGEAGGASFHDARYVIRLNDGKQQFVFTGITEFAVDEFGASVPGAHPALRLNDRAFFQIEFTPRAAECFGGKATISPESP